MAAVILGAPAGRLSLAAQYAVIAAGNYLRGDRLHAYEGRLRAAAARPRRVGADRAANYQMGQLGL